MIHQRTKAVHLYTKVTWLLMTQNKSKLEKVTYCLLVYDPVIILLSNNVFLDSTHRNILYAWIASLMNKISVTGYANFLLLWP